MLALTPRPDGESSDKGSAVRSTKLPDTQSFRKTYSASQDTEPSADGPAPAQGPCGKAARRRDLQWGRESAHLPGVQGAWAALWA